MRVIYNVYLQRCGFIEGLGISYILYGITVAQAYVYMLGCERDAKWIKVMASVVVSLETIHTGVLLRTLWYYAVVVITNPLGYIHIDWSIPAALMLDLTMESIVHSYYIYRVWSFSKNRVLTLVMTVILVVRNGWFLYGNIRVIKIASWIVVENTPIIRSAFLSTYSLTLVLDVILATSMVYYLRRNKTTFQRTRNVVSWLMLYSVNSGAILAAMSLCSIVTFAVFSNRLLYGAFVTIGSKLYANALFGMLNTRNILREKLNEPIVIDTNGIARSYRMHPMHVEISQDRVTDDIMQDTQTGESNPETSSYKLDVQKTYVNV
ncbi:unnamed protein product [Somion occarium]|uniref:DUF6534 domain-containing protein n=1 Tax=Somion occarium TaxID=3059160 RepID=A0ABP1DY23_9APHY